MKRLKQATSGSSYNQVSFQYDEAAPQHGPNPPEPTDEAAEQAYVLPRNFEVPVNIQLPETMKQHAIVEKTARFIASQGMQMEILLKAKQSNNVQFEFLTQNSTLNAYYKHVLKALKEGTYPVEIPAESASTENGNDMPDTPVTNDSMSTETSSSSIVIPTIKYQPSENCAYTQLISKIKGVPLQTVIDDSVREQAKILAQSNAVNTSDGSPKVEILQNSSALALAQNYYSDTESEEEDTQQAQKQQEKLVEAQLQFPIPTNGLKNIIDKTATYVIKNGRKFEETLRNKSEERFTFLLPDNEFYAYYLYKVTGDPAAASKEQKTRKAAAVAAALLSRKGLINDKNASPTPVSFTLKQKEDVPVTNMNAALIQEFSDNEDETQAETYMARGQSVGVHSMPRQMPEQVQKAIQLVESQLMARNSQLVGAAPLPTSTGTVTATCANSTKPASAKQQQHNNKAEQERNALFEQQQQHRQKEMRRAEERVKDKLAQIAREKLCGLISKEKQLQLERKRKALAFLNQIKSSSPQAKDRDSGSITADATTTDTKATNYGSDSDTSVHSIPITSYGPDDEEEEIAVCSEKQGANTTYVNYMLHADSPIPNKLALKHNQAEATVTLVSDDDDVQLVSETRPQKLTNRERRSRSRSYDHKRQRDSKKTRSRSAERNDKHKSGNSRKKKKKSKRHEHSRSSSRSRSRSRSRHCTSHNSWQRSQVRAKSSSEDSDTDQRHEERKRHRQKY